MDSTSSNLPSADHHPLISTDWRSIYVSALVAFIGSIDQSSVMVWPYLQLLDHSVSESFYGILRTISGLSTVISAILAGWLCNRTANTRGSMIAGKLIALVSCSLYLCIELAPPSAFRVRTLFFLFELFLGASVGAASMSRTHVAHASTERDRARAVGVVSLAPAVGLIIGPVVNLVSSAIPFPGWSLLFGLHLNLFTVPILLAMAISALALYLLCFHFDGTIRTHRHMTDEQGSYDRIAVAMCLISRATVSLCLLNLITVGPPYSQMIFRLTSTQMVRFQSYSLGAIGLQGIAWNLAYVFLDMRKRLSERNAIIGSLLILFAAYLATFSWPFLSDNIPYQQLPIMPPDNINSSSSASVEMPLGCPLRFQWCVNTTLVSMPLFMGSMVLALGLAMPISQINLDILYSRVLGPGIRQGTMQGWFIVCGEVLSVALPIALGKSYELHGPVPIWLSILACLLLSLMGWAIFYPRMVPNTAEIWRMKREKEEGQQEIKKISGN